MLKPLLFVSAIVLLGITASSAPGPEPQKAARASASDQKNPVKSAEKSQARAKELYGQDCAICHGETGDGKTDLAKDMGLTLGDWTDPKTLAGKPDQELFDAIRNGKGKMPAELWAAPRTTKCGTLSFTFAASPSRNRPPRPKRPRPRLHLRRCTPAPPTAQTPPASN
jgi:cytochrome c5